MGRIVRDLLALQCDGDRFGHSPHEAYQLTRHGDDHLVGMFPTRHQLTVPCTEPALGLPTDGLHGFGLFCQSELAMAAHFRWVPIRPGAFNEDATGMGIAGCGHGPLAAALATGVC
jgi:hypothetical protein